jgi:hypothetical protein
MKLKLLMFHFEKFHFTQGVRESLEKCHQMSHRGGRGDWVKKCHILFEWPLSLQQIEN